jgi:hypothetical protein
LEKNWKYISSETMALPHKLVHKSDRSDLRSVNVTIPPTTAQDEPLTPTPTKGMQKRLQKIEDVGVKGRALVVGCDGMYTFALSLDFDA